MELFIIDAIEPLKIITGILYFVFGIIIGSFLNVIILRYNTGQMLFGRSGCFSCGKELSWYELIPIVSFVFQLGRCRNCKSKISWQYPAVEAFTGIVFLGIFLKFSNLLFTSPKYLILLSLYFMVVFSILIIIFVYDIRHKIIPDNLVYTFVVLSLGSIFFNISTFQLSIPTILSTFSGPILFTPFFLLWFLSKGRWMGLGDGKLAIGIGWFLGLYAGINSLLISFWSGALIGLFIVLISALYSRGKGITIKSEIPFGPFLILGLLAVFFFEIDILGFILQ